MKEVDLFLQEEIIKTAKGDCWGLRFSRLWPRRISVVTPLGYVQVPGKYTFTNQRIIFRGNGLIEKLRLNFEIPYTEIDDIKTCYALFYPTGIIITLKNGDKYCLSLLRRKSYIDIIERHRLGG